MERLFAKLYQTYEEQEILEAVCSLLIKGDRKERDAFAWYEKALEQGVNLTRLYEYFLYHCRRITDTCCLRRCCCILL